MNQYIEIIPFKIGDIVDHRYEIIGEPISGGMSLVYKVKDVISDTYFAIKTPKDFGLEPEELLPFEREQQALGKLHHNHIIRLEHAGKTENGMPYLVLEWLPSNLASLISNSKPMTWKIFYESFGRPILDALRSSHVQKIAHRDLKPQNILLDENNLPKVADFGIACNVNRAKFGATLKFAGSPPYTPQEPDEGYQTECRDIYSWAAIAISCLTGKIYADLAGLQGGLNALREGEVPKAILSKALSIDANLRQETASVLIADTDNFHLKAIDNEQPITTLYLSWNNSVLQNARSTFPELSEDELRTVIKEDLLKECGAELIEHSMPTQLQLVGNTIRMSCTFDHASQDRFLITQFFFENPSQLIIRRQYLPILKKLNIEFASPPFEANTKSAMHSLFNFLRMREEAVKRSNDESARYHWFDAWNSYLSEKERFYKSRQTRLKADEIRIEGERCIATISSEFNYEEIGASLVIQLQSGKPLIFAIEEIIADRIYMRLISGSSHLVPRNNAVLESNFEAERQSIIRQRNAIEEIRRERSVNPKLLDIICDPNIATPPEKSGLNPKNFKNLSLDKLDILDSALGVQSIYAVKGPPGTGKTTLITELIINYIKRHPERRVLLSSQTHVALDHVIVKLAEKGLKDEVVRVASNSISSSDKIDPSVRELTIDRKARKWAEMAEVRAQEFICKYAKQSGIQADELQVAIIGEAYLSAMSQYNETEKNLEEISQEEMKIDSEREQQLIAGEIPDTEKVLLKTSTLLDRKSKLRESLNSIGMRVNRLKNDLLRTGDFGKAVVEAPKEQAREWIKALDNQTDESQRLKRIIALQLEWLERLSDVRCLHQAILSESRIAAGTCVGLASLPAIYTEEYDLCIVDEASKATAPETLVPMARSRTWVLVGDPNQLPPFFEDSLFSSFEEPDPKYKDTMLSIMLESLPSENYGQLTQQHRMVSGIGNLIGTVFYNSSLENIRTDSERKKLISNTYPKPVTWISTSLKRYKESARGTGYSNAQEVRVVITQLMKLAKNNARSREKITVAILAAYIAQVKALREAVDQIEMQLGAIKVEVNTIDAFQGRDADVCIYSLTRSNDTQKLGFQREKRRLNVALSRAKDALVIIGDDKFCRSVTKNNPFLEVLNYIAENPDFCEIEIL